MSGTVLSQDTFFNANTPLTVIGGGGPGPGPSPGGVNNVLAGLNLSTNVTTGDVTVYMKDNIAGLSSISLASEEANGPNWNITVVGSPPAPVGSLLELGFNDVGYDVATLGYSATGPLDLYVSAHSGALNITDIKMDPQNENITLAYRKATSPGVYQSTNVIVGNGVSIIGGTNLDCRVPIMTSSLTVSTINGAVPTRANAPLDIVTTLTGDGQIVAGSPSIGTLPMGMSIPLSGNNRYLFSPTIGLSTATGTWPIAGNEVCCWITGQTSEVIGGPWTYPNISTMAHKIPTGAGGGRAVLSQCTAGIASASAPSDSVLVPQFNVSPGWPMATTLLISSLQGTNAVFYGTSLYDQGIPSNVL